MSENPLIGKTITAIRVAMDKEAIRFDLQGGDSIVVRVDAECCSSTWIESLDMPSLILGSPVVSVEDIEMPDLGQPDQYDVIAYYGCKIVTAKGSCVIDYRNSSNGYYGGNLSWPGEYFYGGVHGQNVSTMEWGNPLT